jgi:hypothetical protein
VRAARRAKWSLEKFPLFIDYLGLMFSMRVPSGVGMVGPASCFRSPVSERLNRETSAG